MASVDSNGDIDKYIKTRYVKHPLIKENSLEYRDYQVKAVRKALKYNTLVVLPTGSGKTAIALLLSAEWLARYKATKIIFMAPTRPLINQHYQFFLNHLRIPPLDMNVLSGLQSPEDRERLWRAQIIFATPQVVYNDLLRSVASPSDTWLLIFDEAHRAVGNHVYVKIAQLIYSSGVKPRILALTASPGESSKVREIMKNLYIDELMVLTRDDIELRKYLRDIMLRPVFIDPSPHLRYALELLNRAIKNRIDMIKNILKREAIKIDLELKPEVLSFTKLDKLREDIEDAYLNGRISSDARKVLKVLILELIYLDKALSYLESYSYKCFIDYMKRILDKSLRGSMIARRLTADTNIMDAYTVVKALSEKEIYPKLIKLFEIVSSLKSSQVIIFTSTRDTAIEILNFLRKKGVLCDILVGQEKRKGSLVAMSQREQIRVIERFKRGDIKALIATQVGEEGLDIREVEAVVFYDNPISAIRRIQREGRTGRSKSGYVFFLIMKDTRDERRYWAGRMLERKLIREIKNIEDNTQMVKSTSLIEEVSSNIRFDTNVKHLSEYISEREDELKVIIDYREKSPELINYLKLNGIRIELRELTCGDYIVGRYIIERKTVSDFALSIIDGRLFKQLADLKRCDAQPILIIEGDFKEFTKRLDEAVYIGTVLSIMQDYRIPIYRSQSEIETAKFIHLLYKREISNKRKYHKLRIERKPTDIYDIQKFVLAGIPGVDNILSDRLLKYFKNLRNIANANISDIMNVEGIGFKLAEKIWKVFNEEYKA